MFLNNIYGFYMMNLNFLSENKEASGQNRPAACFWNKVLLEYSHPTCLCIIYICYCDYRVKHLQQRPKEKMFTIWPLTAKICQPLS